jgi:4-amino-4-deoxy-L-arabinose transferase-like glycosyltransferase
MGHFCFDYRVVVGLVGLVTIRVAFLGWVPLGLVGDEAYYWDWSRQLDWGYYSKPPMIAWLIAGATTLGGHHAETVRVLAVLFTTGSLAIVYLLARDLFGHRTAVWSIAALALAPAALVQNLIITIDAPLLFFWCTALWCLRRWMVTTAPSERWTWGTGLALCFGLGLLTKQMMAVFPLLALLHMATSPTQREHLRRPGIWLIFLSGTVALMPMLLWNARHDWIMFHHTAHHFQSAPFSLLAGLGRLVEFVAGEIAVTGFVIGGIAAWAWGVSWRRLHQRNLSEPERFLFWFSIPALTVMILMTLRQRLNLNWPLVFLPPLVILAVHWSLGFARGRRLLRAGLILSATLTVLAWTYPVIARLPGIAGGPADLTARLRGWPTLAREVETAMTELPTNPAEAEPAFLLTYGHRYVTSQLAFNLSDHPRVWRWPSVNGAVESQYEVWGGLGNLQGRNALIVHQIDHRHPTLSDSLRSAFVSVSLLREVSVPLGGTRVRRYALYQAHDFTPFADEN